VACEVLEVGASWRFRFCLIDVVLPFAPCYLDGLCLFLARTILCLFRLKVHTAHEAYFSNSTTVATSFTTCNTLLDNDTINSNQ
jgi:hypothetical protein